METLNKIGLIGIINILSISLSAQDFHFSQFRETPMLINPAQTALNKDFRVIVNYKDQWGSLGSPFKTYALSGEFTVNYKKNKPNYLGVGIQILRDKAGDSKTGITLGILSLNAILKIAEYSKLSVGIIGGLGQCSIDPSLVKWGSQYDGTKYNSSLSTGENFASSSFIFPDLGGGMAWSYGRGEKYISGNDGIKATVGLSAFHFGIPKYSYYSNTSEKLNTKLIGHASVSIGLANKNTIIIPELLYVRQGALQEINVGSMFKFIIQENSKYTKNKKPSSYSIGTHYRVGDAFVFTGLYEYLNYSIGISYDFNTSKLTSASKAKGGMEISLKFLAPIPFESGRSRI